MEQWQPFPHALDNTFMGRALFNLRLIFDFQVHTVYGDLKKALSNPAGNILEIGAGAQPYRHLIPKGSQYQSLDWEGAKDVFHYRMPDTVYYNGKDFPFGDNSFDLVFHTEVAEHIFEIQPFLNECHRVLKNGASMFFTTPFNARYHYIPYDFWRFTPSCLEKLLISAGFEEIKIVPRGNDLTVAFVKLNTVFLRIIFLRMPPAIGLAWKAFFGLVFLAPILVLTMLSHLTLLFKLGSTDDPLGYSVYCRKSR